MKIANLSKRKHVQLHQTEKIKTQYIATKDHILSSAHDIRLTTYNLSSIHAKS